MQEALTRATGELVFSDAVRKFVGALQEQGFLETEEFYKLWDQKQAEFREGSEHFPVHAGGAYPASASEVRSTLEGYFEAVRGPSGLSSSVLGVAAPHVSPEGGRNCYAVTYRGLATLPTLPPLGFRRSGVQVGRREVSSRWAAYPRRLGQGAELLRKITVPPEGGPWAG